MIFIYSTPSRRKSGLSLVGSLLANLSGYGRPVDPVISEEIQSVPTTFNISGTAEPIWNNKEIPNIPMDSNFKSFNSFIDGVQRSSVVYWITLDNLGVMVPIVMGHIAAGVTIRGADKKLRADKFHIRDRILLLLPLRGMIEAGFQGGNIINEWIDKGLVIPDRKIAEDPIEGLGYDKKEPPIILCDTTFNKISRTPEEENQKINEAMSDPEKPTRLLIDKNLYNISEIRSRAQGRINIIRQILEMLILTKFREERGNEDLILVDGPLFFLGKWLRKYDILKNKNDSEREEFVLKNAVGLVKTLKGRPKNIDDLKKILYLEEGQISDIMYLNDAVDLTGEEYENIGYSHPHITTYLRLKTPPKFRPPSIIGLVRVDLHLSTIGADTLDEAKSDRENTTKEVNKIIKAVLNEKYPGVFQVGRSYTEVYPIKETERMLQSKLYSTLEMKYIYSMIRTQA